MNLLRQCRHILELSQPKYGKWLAERTGRPEPYPASRISELEHGLYGLNKDIRRVCAPEVVEDVLERLGVACTPKNKEILLEV